MGMNNDWLSSVFSDGTKNFVSDPVPDIGETVEITIQMRADAPIKHVLVRSIPNGAERYDTAELTKERHGLKYYTAKVPITEYRTAYQFDLVTEDCIYFYTQKGITTYIPDHTYDFVLLSDYLQPEWVKGAVFYQIFPERFANGNPDNDVRNGEYEYQGHRSIHMDSWDALPLPPEQGNAVDFFGGDLDGIIQKLDYLQQEVGVTALYINPVFSSFSTHKYDCIDYFHVDEHFGGDEALARLCDAVHKRGMKIILDISINHTGIEHKWVKEGRPYYFKKADGSLQGWFDVETLPILDYRNEELRDLIYRREDSVLLKWLRPPYSIDGWRFDVADVFARNNEVQLADELWVEICGAIRRENPEAFIIGEDWGDCAKFLQGHQWNSPMNYFGFGRIIRQFAGLPDLFLERHKEFADAHYAMTAQDVVERTIEHYAKIPQVIADCQMNLFDSHDIARMHNYDEIDFDKWKAAVIAQLLWTGIPCIYYGDELGIDGYTCHDAGFRYPMPWNHVTEEGRCHLEVVKTMTRLRQGSDAFSHGSRKVLVADGRVLAVARFFGDEIYIGVISMEDEARSIELPLADIGVDRLAASSETEMVDLFGTTLPGGKEWKDSGRMLIEAHGAYLLAAHRG